MFANLRDVNATGMTGDALLHSAAISAAREDVDLLIRSGANVNAPVMALAIGVLVLAAAVSGIIPARRAASIDPVRALRIE